MSSAQPLQGGLFTCCAAVLLWPFFFLIVVFVLVMVLYLHLCYIPPLLLKEFPSILSPPWAHTIVCCIYFVFLICWTGPLPKFIPNQGCCCFSMYKESHDLLVVVILLLLCWLQTWFAQWHILLPWRAPLSDAAAHNNLLLHVAHTSKLCCTWMNTTTIDNY